MPGPIIPLATSNGGGNATVPADAPIHPPQAFVDNIREFSKFTSDGLVLSDRGITYLDPALIVDMNTDGGWFPIALSYSGFPSINLSGNVLSVANINAILEAIVYFGPAGNYTLNLSGNGMGAPTGQGLVDKQVLISVGWTVLTN